MIFLTTLKEGLIVMKKPDKAKELALWESATREMEKAHIGRLANWLAHGYEIESVKTVTVLVRDDKILIMDKGGVLLTAQKTL